MNLEEAIEELEELKETIKIAFWNKEYIDKKRKAIDVILNELNRLKEETDILRKELVDISSKSFQEGYQDGFKQAKFHCEMDKLDGR